MDYEIKYYVNGHTANGFVDFLSSNLVDIKKVIVLQHPSNRIKTSILKAIAHQHRGSNNIELIASPQSNNYLDGVIVRNLSLAILNEKELKRGKKIDLQKFFSVKVKENNEEYLTEINKLLEEAYQYFKEALTIHDELEKIYINQMNFLKADEVAENLMINIFSNIDKKQCNSTVYERLFGTNTPDGIINHVEQLISPIQNRIFIKGRAGTGKSVLMKKILAESIAYGIDVELYRCSFDPTSIDMLIIRDLDFCIFDSTSPHEFFPTRKNDIILDLYTKTVNQGTDEIYANEITSLTTRYKDKMKKGIQKLQATKKFEQLIESYWLQIENKQLEEIFNEVMKEI